MTTYRTAVTPTLPRRGFDSFFDDRRAPVRIRTRGPLLSEMAIENDAELQSFLGRLRETLQGLPLNIVIADADLSDASAASYRFLNALLPFIDADVDTVWLLTRAPSDGPPPTGCVVLEAGNADDTHLRDNLVADVLFCAGAVVTECDELRRFEHRASLAMIVAGAEHAVALALAASRLRITALEWDASQSTVRVAAGAVRGPEAAAEEELTGEQLDDVGSRLATLATQLTTRRERRHLFREAVLRLVRDYQSQPRWGEYLIRLADKFDWPSWAIEMLPKLYLRLGSSGERALVAALVWRPIFTWLPRCEEYIVKGSDLCRGEILRVDVPAEIDALLSLMQAEIEENLRGNPYHGDEVFFGRISDAVDAVASACRESDVQMAQALDRLTQELLRSGRPRKPSGG